MKIKCSFCGASYSEAEMVCPYCGAENVEYSKREQKQVLDEYREKTENAEIEVTEEKSRRGTKNVTKILIIAGVAIAIFFAIIFYVRNEKIDSALDDQEAIVNQLEMYLENGQYSDMVDYLYNTENTYGGTFGKYKNIADVYGSFRYDLEYADNLVENINLDSDVIVKMCSISLNELFHDLDKIKEYEAEGFLYGEEQYMMIFQDMIYDVFLNKYKMTEDEIDKYYQIMPEKLDDTETYMEFANEIYNRMKVGE